MRSTSVSLEQGLHFSAMQDTQRSFVSRAISEAICKPAETKFWANRGGYQGSREGGGGDSWCSAKLEKAEGNEGVWQEHTG